jgi:fermentation-respiration switch protein FrsA (DUF1100 family)
MKLKKKKMIEFLFAFLGIYLLWVVILYTNQRNYIYIPDRARPAPSAYDAEAMEVITVPMEDGTELQAWYGKPADASKPVILFFHGNAGNIGGRAGKAAVFLQAGYGVLLAEYSGYGGNPGAPSEQTFYANGRAYVDWLAGQGVTSDRIVLYGESIGSGTAVQIATENPGIRALILEAPFSSLVDSARMVVFYAPVPYLLKDHFDNLSKITKVRAPLLWLHGKRDSVVPYRLGAKLFKAANEPKTAATFSSGGHNDLYLHGAGQEILKFLAGL